ncbi:MAG: anthranilate synthase component I [Candidatus Wallbacteria bacterium]|nr:anthranilate synthase component I [Candidatus Wallbacteria bacterium]
MKPLPSKNDLFLKRLTVQAFPEAVFERLYNCEKYAFLYESLENDGERGRYSFIGGRPFLIFRSTGKTAALESAEGCSSETGDPLEVLRGIMKKYDFPLSHQVFTGGAVGFMSYDAVRLSEQISDRHEPDFPVPDMYFIFPSEIMIFDHLKKTVDIIIYGGFGDARFNEIEAAVTSSSAPCPAEVPSDEKPFPESNFTREEFEDRVRKAQEYILAGDIFQVVLSQRFSFPMKASPLSVYRELRKANPSPYMYFLQFDGLHILGSSPETLVSLKSGTAVTKPIAGTRRRGRTEEEDMALERELLADEKERAEHVMLVDLARNDLGRVCEYGSVRVDEFFGIERFSRVMHIVSEVSGRIRPEYDMFDLFTACFPAGTVSGAPKVRAMEIIDELENCRRGIYAGAIGYFDFCGNMDVCITIRTIVMSEGRAFIQAGAGIVADSQPELEYKETINKAQALMKAVGAAE